MRAHSTSLFLPVLALLIAALVAPVPAAAEPETTSDLLLPFFEVDYEPAGRTTLFAVSNAGAEPVTVRAAVFSNWGIELVSTRLELAPSEVRTVNLRDWLLSGELPTRQIGPAELAHLQAALAGQPSPRDDLYYGTEVMPGRAVGYVTLRIASTPRSDVLWGDYFWVDPGQDFAEGELLVDIDRTSDCPGLCDRHLLRFLEGGGFDGGTKLIVWSPKRRNPSPVPLGAGAIGVGNVISVSDFHRESGERFDERALDLLPVELLDVRDLLLAEKFGWLDVGTDEDVYIGVRYSADRRYSVALQSWCLKDPPPPRDPPDDREAAIDIEKSTNGEDADDPLGPLVQPGDPITWEYVVTNTGDLNLTDVLVTDDQEGAIDCPKSALIVGESMTCTQTGTAADLGSTSYRNVGTVTGRDPDGKLVRDDDPSHYSNPPDGPIGNPVIRVEKATNGVDADTPTGPEILVGDPVTWTYVVSNPSNEVTLLAIALSDDKLGPVPCPKTTLAPGESMTCTANGTAQLGQYANLATVRGENEGGVEVTDTDPSHYLGVEDPPASIDVEKATNGEDADSPTGPSITVGNPVTWTYVVTNDGQVPLSGVSVTDDKLGSISCPKSSLAPAESMTCTANGTARAGQYRNEALARGTAPDGEVVEDRDPSHYIGREGPAIDVEKSTNGQDADTPTGPILEVGEEVVWRYVVTNVGDVRLTSIRLSDDKLGAVACPRSALDPGESMTCVRRGTARKGQYKNEAWVEGTSPGGQKVEDHDDSHYKGVEPKIDLEKKTNGHDADHAPGPTLEVGSEVTWTYRVRNTGEVPLSDVSVMDDRIGAISCPKSSLAVGESMTCTAKGTAQAGQYRNEGWAEGESPKGTKVEDHDPSHYFGEEPCGPCLGKVSRLTVRYLGASAANVRVVGKRGGSNDELFDDLVFPGGTFEIVGPPHPNGGFDGTLGTEIDYFVDGVFNANMHTSCSQPIGPGLVRGDFEVVAGESKQGGPLCPL